MGTHMFLPKCSNYRTQQTKLLQSDAYNVRRIAIQQLNHTQPIVSPSLRTSPAQPGPDVDTVAAFIGLANFRLLVLIATGLYACTSCTLCASRFSILTRQS